jgi:hypothetical protein
LPQDDTGKRYRAAEVWVDELQAAEKKDLSSTDPEVFEALIAPLLVGPFIEVWGTR